MQAHANFFKLDFKTIWRVLLLISVIKELGELLGARNLHSMCGYQFGLMFCLSVGSTGKANKAPSLAKSRIYVIVPGKVTKSKG